MCALAVVCFLHVIIVVVILTIAIGGIITFTFDAIGLLVKIDVPLFYPACQPSNKLAAAIS